MKIAFHITEPWEKERIEHTTLASECELSFFDHAVDIEHVPTDADAEALSVFVDSKLDADTLAKFPNLRFIATRSTGFDHIDLAATAARGITVANVPSYGSNTVAEHAFALLLALSKRICDGVTQVRERCDFDPHGLRGFDLQGKTLGVIGTGKIGKHAVAIGKGFGMNVVLYDTYPDEVFAQENGVSYLSLNDLLATSDVVTLHVPYLPATHHLINKGNVDTMRQGSVIINTSRGAVIETDAIVHGLECGRLRGVGLDVLEEEDVLREERHLFASGKMEGRDLKTVLENHMLIGMSNVIITPHSAYNTQEALERIMQTSIDNLLAYVHGTPQNVVPAPSVGSH